MSRFDPTIAELQKSLQHHAEVTAELQRRIVEARHHISSHSGDPRLLAILSGVA